MKFWVNSQHGIKDVFGELVVVPVFNGDFQGASPCDSSSFVECDSIMDGGIMRLARNEAFDGGKGSMLRYFADEAIAASQVMLLGLGDKDAVSRDVLQDALAKMFKKVSALKLSEVTVDMRPLLHDSKFDAYALGEQLGYLATFLDHTVLHYKTKKGGHEGDHAISTLRALVPDVAHKGFREGMYAGRDIARGVNLARDLVETPAGDLTPTGMVAAAKKVIAASDGKISGNFFYPDKLKKMGAGALLGVAQGSKEPAVLIELDYTPSTGPTEEVLCLIGKTVTFDSGGLDLKPAAGMLTMKRDMSGGAAVLGAIQAIADLELPISVKVIMAATENKTGSNAYRPGDVLRSMSGLTIEIGNTDAEGRLTLADAIEFARRRKVSAIVDFATLTGAVVSIGGDVAAACFGNNDRFTSRVKNIAECHGEPMIHIPMSPELKELNDSDIADIKNTGGRLAGSTTAAWFLRAFAGEETPWVHVDIAGTAYRDRSIGICPKGASGYGVRTAVALAAEYAQDRSLAK
ncbi:MAG: leucyl aminopeptidase [Candidatus Obscuribacterales bacterium]|nr:leucyl aminopeptidase [Candidatus Obscuribacterales bacterium]